MRRVRYNLAEGRFQEGEQMMLRKIWTPTVRQALLALIVAVAAAIVDALTGLIGVV